MRRRTLIITAAGLVAALAAFSAVLAGLQAPPFVRPDRTVDQNQAPDWVPAAGAGQDTVLVDAATGNLACFPSGLKPVEAPGGLRPSRAAPGQAARPSSPPAVVAAPVHVPSDTPGLLAVSSSSVPAGASCGSASSQPTVFILDRETGRRVTVPAGQGRAVPDLRDATP